MKEVDDGGIHECHGGVASSAAPWSAICGENCAENVTDSAGDGRDPGVRSDFLVSSASDWIHGALQSSMSLFSSL